MWFHLIVSRHGLRLASNVENGGCSADMREVFYSVFFVRVLSELWAF